MICTAQGNIDVHMLQSALQMLVMKITLLPEALSYRSCTLGTVCHVSAPEPGRSVSWESGHPVSLFYR